MVTVNYGAYYLLMLRYKSDAEKLVRYNGVVLSLFHKLYNIQMLNIKFKKKSWL